jgi:hypothetical protein
MVKLPDPGALGQSPNLRGARGAQVDPRLLRGGVGDVLEGALASSKAYQQGGQAIARSMGTAGEALGRAAGGDVALGRTIQDVGGEAGRATQRAGAAVAGAMERSGDYWARAVKEAGEDDRRAFNELGAAFQKTAGDIVEFQLAQDKQDFAKAQTAEAIARDNLNQEFQRDQDYATMPDRYSARLKEIHETTGAMVKNPAMREKFTRDTSLIGTRSVNNIRDRAWGVEKDINNANRLEELEKLAEGALREGDEVARANNLLAGQRTIDAAVGKGYINAADGVRQKRVFSERYSEASLESMPPERQLEVIAARRAGQTGTMADFIPAHRLDVVEEKATRKVTAKRTTEIRELGEQYERGIIEFNAGNSKLYPRKMLEDDPNLPSSLRNNLLRQHDTASKERGNYNDVLRLYTTPGATANPFDKDHRKGVDKLYDALKVHMGAGPAAEAISFKLKIVPEEVVTDMRGALVSNDPKKVEAALQAATNLMRNNEHAFAGHQSTKGITDSADTFSYYVERLRFTPAEAAERIIREGIDKDERKANFKKRLKDEKIDDIIVKNTDESELRQQFNEGWFFSKPGQIEYTPKQRDEFVQSYRELVQSNYMESADGDIEKAKSKAVAQLKRGGGWGVTSVNGTNMVTNFPPEKAPVYSGIRDLSSRIAKQAVDDVKASTGEVLDRTRIRLVPLPKGGTSIEFDAGRPPPYMLMYQDRNGTWQVHPQNFVADPRVMRGEITAEDVKASEAYRQRVQDISNQPGPAAP